jgi:hypothetical protein
MKTILNFCIGVLATIQLTAQVNGPNTGSSSTTSSIGGYSQTWTNTGNVNSSDDVYSSFGNLADVMGSYSNYLTVTDFGFSIPSATIIRGIQVEVERSDPNSKTSDYSIRIIKAGIIGSTEKSTGTAYPATDAYISYGGSTDLWGDTWSFKNIGNNDFGVAIAAQRNATGGVTGGQIDNVRITVYYDYITLPLTLTSFTAAKGDKEVVLRWNTSSESNMDHYEVERSGDGRSFSTMASIPALNQSSANYSYTDNNPLPGTSYYRLIMQGASGDRNYSKIVTVHYTKNNSITLSPSPWTKGNDLTIRNPSRELLTIEFYKDDGKIIGKSTTSTSQVPVSALSDTKGLLYFKVLDEKNQVKGSGSLVVY